MTTNKLHENSTSVYLKLLTSNTKSEIKRNRNENNLEIL